MVAVFRGFGLEEQEPISKENPVNFNLDDKPCYEKGNIHSVCTAARSGELQIRLNVRRRDWYLFHSVTKRKSVKHAKSLKVMK
jgi:hypothetical protein